jgi:hypothetical protein
MEHRHEVAKPRRSENDRRDDRSWPFAAVYSMHHQAAIGGRADLLRARGNDANDPDRTSPLRLDTPCFAHSQTIHAWIRRLRTVDTSASGFDMLRAQSMKSAASGLTVRFFSVTMPTGRGGMGNSMGRALSPRRLPLNLKNNPGSTDRKRPVPRSAPCMLMPYPATAICGTAKPLARKAFARSALA